MEYEDFMEKWAEFSKMIPTNPAIKDEFLAKMVKQYTEHTLDVLNDILMSNMSYLKRLNAVSSPNEIPLLQSQFMGEMTLKMTQASQRFMSMTATDMPQYNEWMKKHGTGL